jgi:hypothetical protein
MRYFVIGNSLNTQILGNYPQTKTIKYNCDVWNEPHFIEHVHNEKIDFEPIVSNAILSPKSKLTDLIDVTGMGFTRKLLISSKLRKIIEKYCKSGIQFFQSPIIHRTDIIPDYWVMNAYNIRLDLIDYYNSEIFSRRRKAEGGTYLIEEKISDMDSFIKKREEYNSKKTGNLFIKKVKILPRANEDFFTLH